MAGNPDGGPNVKTLMVKIGPQEFNNASFDITNVDGKGTKATRASMGWTDKYEDFTAQGNSSRIQFISTTVKSPYGPALDNVRIEQLDDAPEPGSWLLMLTGLGFVAARWIPRGRSPAGGRRCSTRAESRLQPISAPGCNRSSAAGSRSAS